MTIERILLVFPDAGDGHPGWALVVPGGVVGHGVGLAELPAGAEGATVALAAPGDRVALHWLDLPPELAPAQAAAAATLMIAAKLLQPADMVHVAVGGMEEGLRCVGIVAEAELVQWIALVAPFGLSPDLIVPEPLLLLAPETGLRRRDAEGLSCFRGAADGFAVEPALAHHLVDEKAVGLVDDAAFEAELFEAILRAPLNLRQGRFAKRRIWRPDLAAGRRVAAIAAALMVATFAVGVADLFRHAQAAGRIEREARALAPPAGAAGPRQAGAAASFASMSSALFAAVRATPNAELAALNFAGAGTLATTVTGDSAATIEALRARIAESGYRVDGSAAQQTSGGAQAALVVRLP